MDNHIVPECYTDTLLIQTLVPPLQKGRYNHQHGCFQVCNTLEKGYLKDKFAVGIIDDDKNKALYLRKFRQIDIVEDSLKLYRHSSLTIHHYFIMLQPAIESWILQVCKQTEINITKFDLPDDLTALKKVTKAEISTNDQRFKNLFLTFKMSNNPSVLKLTGWLHVLKEKNYNLNIDELKRI